MLRWGELHAPKADAEKDKDPASAYLCKHRGNLEIAVLNVLALHDAARGNAAASQSISPDGQSAQMAAWQANPVQVFDDLHKLALKALEIVISVHESAISVPRETSIEQVEVGSVESLRQTIEIAQQIWFSTPIQSYLVRPEGAVHLDTMPASGQRITGSCYHDLALGLAVGLYKGIMEKLPAANFVAYLRCHAAVGDGVAQRLATIRSEVQCEWMRGVERWKAETSGNAVSDSIREKMAGERLPSGRQIAAKKRHSKPKVASKPTTPISSNESDDNNPPVEILAHLTITQRKLFVQLWKKTKSTLNSLASTVWKEKAIENASMQRAAQRLGDRLLSLGHKEITIEVSGDFILLKRPDK